MWEKSSRSMAVAPLKFPWFSLPGRVSVYMPWVYCCSPLEGGQCVLVPFGYGNTCREEATFYSHGFPESEVTLSQAQTHLFCISMGTLLPFLCVPHCDFLPLSYVTVVSTSLKSDFISLIKHIMSLSNIEVCSMINDKVLWTGCQYSPVCKGEVICFWHLLCEPS